VLHNMLNLNVRHFNSFYKNCIFFYSSEYFERIMLMLSRKIYLRYKEKQFILLIIVASDVSLHLAVLKVHC
jgi:hypothetical protein